jgi:hypothetical protein
VVHGLLQLPHLRLAEPATVECVNQFQPEFAYRQN